MGMLYVLDEPSIGLHPKDNVKMIATLESLRDIGNTVIVVEHDEDTIRAADHLVEMGPGPGIHGGTVVVQGTMDDVLACKASPTGQFLSGKRSIATPTKRRERQRQVARRPRSAREQPQSGGRDVPAGQARGDHGRFRLGQEHARQRRALQGALEATRRHAHAARRARRCGRSRICAKGRQHRSIADRTEQPVESGDVRRLLRRDPRPVHPELSLGGARLQARPVQLQRQGGPMRGMPGRGRDRHAALFHARRRGDLRRLQGRAVQRRDA